MPEADSSARPEWITLMHSPDSISVQMAQQLLQSAEIEFLVEAVNKKSETAFLSGIQPGYRVLVRQKDIDQAHDVLSFFENSTINETPEAVLSSREIEARDAGVSAARKALQVSVLGFLLGPLLHPFSLLMALRTLRRKGLPDRSRRDAMVAAGISLFSLVFFAIMIYSLLR